MEIIKPLSESVQSMVRSGFIIDSLTTVVEELIYNSLDAGATKVLVSVAVNNGYVKVEDDGSGISRDGLLLLGERYATSKLGHFHEKDACEGSFGFRGEVLCSIADISLLKIITRVHGRPNGYRKIMKGRKCLCLSIDNDRLEVGTTVIVRDLFYNQPVRRRQMQGSVKKVLHSVKKVAVRIALVRPTIFFKVTDMESENELICTRSCPPLSLLCSNFGIEASSLHEVSFSEGLLKLTGYVSSISGFCSSKVVQYIYVNSRFVNKGPIHKLLNSLADMLYNELKVDRGERRGHPHAGPSYCLNLTCPRYSYDLNLEFSRASIEFKDWSPVLSFVKRSVTSLWSEETMRGISHNHIINQISNDGIEKKTELTSLVEKGWGLKSCERSTKRRKTHNDDNLHASPEMLVEDFGFSPSKDFSGKNMNLDREESPCSLDFTRVDDASLSNSIFKFPTTVHNVLESDKKLEVRPISRGNDFTKERVSHFSNDYHPISEWKEDIYDDVCSFEFELENERKMTSDEHLNCIKEFPIENFLAKSCNYSHVKEDTYSLDQSFDDIQRGQFHREETSTWLLPESNIGSSKRKEIDIDDVDYDNFLLPPSGGSFNREYHGESSSNQGNMFLPCSEYWDFDTVNEAKGFERRLGVRNIDGFDQSTYEKEDFNRDITSNRCRTKDFPSTSSIDSTLFFTNDYVGHLENTWEMSRYGDNVDELSRDVFFEDTCHSSVCWSPLIPSKRGIETEYRRLGHDYVSMERSGRNYDSPDSLLGARSCSLTDNEAFSPCNLNQVKSSVCFSPLKCGTGPELDFQGCRAFVRKHSSLECQSPKRSIRSRSAPPFYKERAKSVHQETPDMSSNTTHHHDGIKFEEDSLFCFEKKVKEPSHVDQFSVQLQDGDHNIDYSNEVKAPESSQNKWREGCPDATLFEIPSYLKGSDRSIDHKSENGILDLQSSMLDLSRDSLVPKSISRSGLENAKVLSQVDNKFIPVVANGTLALIDQHAADERIRLEEMRQKVLSGEMKSICYLEEEKNLLLPELSYQLLCNYAERIKQWGWICNIFSQHSKSFTKNLDLLNERASHLTLIAVPCILGVNLSDKDLLEYLEQLADTDGSSNIPPSVVRVLNSKACRGAIMFGDKLKPSECSLIVEELKQTSLCFQCAHGRPTTVPLLNLKALHDGILQLGSYRLRSENTWHGLHKHEITLDRAKHRLDMARG